MAGISNASMTQISHFRPWQVAANSQPSTLEQLLPEILNSIFLIVSKCPTTLAQCALTSKRFYNLTLAAAQLRLQSYQDLNQVPRYLYIRVFWLFERVLDSNIKNNKFTKESTVPAIDLLIWSLKSTHDVLCYHGAHPGRSAIYTHNTEDRCIQAYQPDTINPLQAVVSSSGSKKYISLRRMDGSLDIIDRETDAYFTLISAQANYIGWASPMRSFTAIGSKLREWNGQYLRRQGQSFFTQMNHISPSRSILHVFLK